MKSVMLQFLEFKIPVAKINFLHDPIAGAQPALHFGGGAIFMKFHLMTSSCLFNRGTTFSQTVTYIIIMYFLICIIIMPADTKSIVHKHTHS